jgi:hypothetical protein
MHAGNVLIGQVRPGNRLEVVDDFRTRFVGSIVPIAAPRA